MSMMAGLLGLSGLLWCRALSGPGEEAGARSTPSPEVSLARYTEDQTRVQHTVEALRTEVQQLRAQLQEQAARSKARPMASRVQVAPSPQTRGAPAPNLLLTEATSHIPDAPDRVTAPAAPSEPIAHRVKQLEDRFQTEAYDAPWATDMADRVATALELEEFASTSLVVVSCQSTLCRLDLEHADASAERHFLQAFISTLGLGAIESLYTHSAAPDGTVTMTLYLSRDGYRLSQLD